MTIQALTGSKCPSAFTAIGTGSRWSWGVRRTLCFIETGVLWYRLGCHAIMPDVFVAVTCERSLQRQRLSKSSSSSCGSPISHGRGMPACARPIAHHAHQALVPEKFIRSHVQAERQSLRKREIRQRGINLRRRRREGDRVCLWVCVWGGVQIEKNKGEVNKVHFQQTRQVGQNVLRREIWRQEKKNQPKRSDKGNGDTEHSAETEFAGWGIKKIHSSPSRTWWDRAAARRHFELVPCLPFFSQRGSRQGQAISNWHFVLLHLHIANSEMSDPPGETYSENYSVAWQTAGAAMECWDTKTRQMNLRVSAICRWRWWVGGSTAGWPAFKPDTRM